MVPYQSDDDETVEVIDYTEMLNNVAAKWRSSKKSTSSSDKKKPAVSKSQNKTVAPKVKSFWGALKNAFSYLFTITFFGTCFAYAFMFKKYHVAVQKHNMMTELFHNPRARVASGDKAKSILASIQPPKVEVPKVEQPINAFMSYEQRKNMLIRSL